MSFTHALKPAQKEFGGLRGTSKRFLAATTTAVIAVGLSVVGASPAYAAIGTISAAASCQVEGGAQVVLTYSNPDVYSMYANGGFGEPTNDLLGLEHTIINEGPMMGQEWGLFYEGTATSEYDGGGFNVATGTAKKTFTIPDGANGGSINFGFFVKAGAEKHSYIARQDITVNTNCPAPLSHVVIPEDDIDTFEAGDGSNYTNWHEGYANASKSFSVDGTGLSLGDPAHSQILKGLDTSVAGVDLEEMLTTKASVIVESGTVTYQVAFEHDGAIGWGTLRSASLGAGGHTFSLTDPWLTSQAIGGSISANTSYPLGDLLDALVAEGGSLGTAFGVQADNAAHISSIRFGDTEYSFVNPAGTTCEAPDFASGKYEVHLGRGLEERNQPPVFDITSFGGLVSADDPSDTFLEIQGYGAGWTNTYIRTQDEPGHDFSNGYVITYTFVNKVVTGTVTVGNNGCNSLVWAYKNVMEVDRLAGSNRYGTAAAVAQEWAAASVVYIATGLGFADALSAGPAAAFNDAPLLLTAPDALSSAAKTELMRMQPDTIIVVGGEGAVSAHVKSELVALSFAPTVERIGGSNRYVTSQMIADQTFPHGSVDTAYLADGMNFPDALTASPAAAHFDGPVVLVPGNASSVDAATLSLLGTLGVTEVKVAGGSAVVTDAIVTQLNGEFGASNVKRNSGSNRYLTAVAVNADEFTTATVVYLATGANFADALAGAAIAGSQGAPLFISTPTCIPAQVMDAITALNPLKLVLLGGTGVLTASVESMTVCS